jgi:hypothetical protein
VLKVLRALGLGLAPVDDQAVSREGARGLRLQPHFSPTAATRSRILRACDLAAHFVCFFLVEVLIMFYYFGA